MKMMVLKLRSEKYIDRGDAIFIRRYQITEIDSLDKVDIDHLNEDIMASWQRIMS